MLNHCFLDIKKDSGGRSIYRRKELFPLNCILVNFSYSASVFYAMSLSGLWILFNYTHENAFLLSWHSFAEITFFKGDHSWKLPMQSLTKGKKKCHSVVKVCQKMCQTWNHFFRQQRKTPIFCDIFSSEIPWKWGMPNKVHYNNDGNLDGMIDHSIPTVYTLKFFQCYAKLRELTPGLSGVNSCNLA